MKIMKTITFDSNRINKLVTILFTLKKVHYITEDDEIISIEHDICWHFNEDGLLRAQEYFDDPRFDYWTNMEYEFCNYK